MLLQLKCSVKLLLAKRHRVCSYARAGRDSASSRVARRGALLSGRTACCATQQTPACPASSAARATHWSTAPAVSSLLHLWAVPCESQHTLSLASDGCPCCRRAPASLAVTPARPSRHSAQSRAAPPSCSAGSQLVACSCQACPAGTFSPGGSSACTPCPAGSFCPAGSASATPCPAGTRLCGGQRGVRALPSPGPHLAAGSAACTPCPAGSSSSGGDACAPCPDAPELAGRGPVRALPRRSERFLRGTVHRMQPARERQLCRRPSRAGPS